MSSTEQDSENERVKFFLGYYKTVLEEFVTPLPLLDKMPDFNREVGLKIREASHNPQEQVEIFLEELENSANSATLQIFLNALNHSDDQRFIYQVLNGDLTNEEYDKFFQLVEEMPQKRKLLELLMPHFAVINAEHCITALNPWLSDGERDLLRAMCQKSGNYNTIWWIFSFIIRKEPDWIKEFHLHVKYFNYSNPEEGTLAKLLTKYFEIDHEDSEEKETMPYCNFGTTSEQPSNAVRGDGNEEMVFNITCSEEAGVADVESKITHSQSPQQADIRLNNLNVTNPKCNMEENILDPTLAGKNGEEGVATPEWQPKPLREYQKELVAQAKERKNVIICAPPGSGKTIVAANIMMNYLERSSNVRKPVLFFTPGGALAEQQHQRLEDYLPPDYTVDYICGTRDNTSLDVIASDVIVLTPQILLNALKCKSEESKVTSLGEFDLLIFDECHHCMKGHAYNTVMREYFSLKREILQGTNKDGNLPQIVGLTATLGVGKKSDRAFDEILKLCSNMDAHDGIVTVRDPLNLQELHKYVPHPEEETIPLEPKKKDPFVRKVVSIMETIGEILKDTEVCDSAPTWYDTEDKKQAYTAWCVTTKNDIAKSQNEKGRTAYSCIEYLEASNDALDLHSKCRVVNAVHAFEKFLEIKVADSFNEVEKKLFALLKNSLKDLRGFCEDERCENKSLKEIENLILTRFSKDPESKGMLMVQKRAYTAALKEWMDETESLKFLNARVFTGLGSNTNASNTGLTHAQQSDIMKLFREEDVKMLVCTPEAAGEGMDVAGCSLVINYDYMRNEIATVQIKGRVRKTGGEMYQLSSQKVALREKLNIQRTLIMQKAVVDVQCLFEDSLKEYLHKLDQLQIESRLQDRLALLKELSKPPRNSDKEYLLQCRKCQTEACSSLDIRLVENGQHTNPKEEFKTKYQTIDHPRKNSMGPNWRKKSKILCAKCGNDWGIEAEWNGCLTLPLVKIEGLRIVDTNALKPRVYTPKKWKGTPFAPIPASLSDMLTELDIFLELT